MKTEIVKCGYKYCKCNDELLKHNAIKVGNRYYHKSCEIEKNNKEKSIELYKKYYKSCESEMIINKVINQIVNEKGFDSEYVLYAICKAIKNKTPLKAVFGLHYVVDNQDYIASYKLMKAKENVKNLSFNETETSEDIIMNYNNKSSINWSETLFK
jgi:hypothetical protein